HLDVIATPVTATDGDNRGVHGTNRGRMLREGAAARFHGVATGSREGLKKLPRAGDPNPPERVQREKMRFVSRYQEVRFAPERALQDQVVSGILDDAFSSSARIAGLVTEAAAPEGESAKAVSETVPRKRRAEIRMLSRP